MQAISFVYILLIVVYSALAPSTQAFTSLSTQLKTRSLVGKTFAPETLLFSSSTSPISDDKMFTLLVVMRFRSEEAKSAWSKSMVVLDKYVKEKEPNTLQYQFSQSTDDPLVITIFETYTSKADFEEVHMKSEGFLQHVERMKPYDNQIKEESFITGNVIEQFGYFSK